MKNTYQDSFDFLYAENSAKRIASQLKARKLLFEGFEEIDSNGHIDYPQLAELRTSISPATEIFAPNDLQQTIYHADTGTHIIPALFKRLLANIKSAFIIRPGDINDVQLFVKWAFKNKVNYTIRGAGTWPFGGCVPLNNDVILDLSNLDFMRLNQEECTVTVGAGVIFQNAHKYLSQNGFSLRQDISNPGSGTITGWIATGGLGLGSYKYGHVANSTLMLLIVQPNGQLLQIDREDERFNRYFGSEGQLGVIVGAVLQVRKETYVTKPYAFCFNSADDAHHFMKLVDDSHLKPTSVIYFNESYIEQTYYIEKEHLEKRAQDSLDRNDQVRLSEAREDRDVIRQMRELGHVVVLHFDENDDYQNALKSRLFGLSGEKRRINHIQFRQLPTPLAHLLWEHRYLPVQIKQKGPSLLVSETVLPFSNFLVYHQFLNKILGRLLNIDLKAEAHLLPDGEILVQSIFLADTRTLRHKLYFALVPLMSTVAHHFKARPYGVGMWNYPFIKEWRSNFPERANLLADYKKETDPNNLLNRGKFLNSGGQNIPFKLFKVITPLLMKTFVKGYHKRSLGQRNILFYPFEKLMWHLSKWVLPHLFPPELKLHEKKPIENLISVCAECDSCERVCPTSDVFGIYGAATPITRRITAHRLANGAKISREEALGFLVCTRCDNCTHICPTNIRLTDLFDRVEENKTFNEVLELDAAAKTVFIDRAWQIMKKSPLYIKHTLADQKEERSHLSHGLRIIYEKGFEYGQLYIDPTTCIHCGMCSNENACTYAAREGHAREIPELLDVNCALCNACVNFCPQNKIAQQQRQIHDKLIYNAVDLDEKRYWIKQQNRIHDTTKVIRSTQLTEMADRYLTEEIIMEIDKEASTGRIPVSGMGQGDRHMGIGFDAERFAHFHIVGPAQNRLHEGDPEEELSVTLGKREDFCKFDRGGNLVNPEHPNIKLMTPILYNTIPLESNGKVELALIKIAEMQKSLVVLTLERMIEHYKLILKEGAYEQLPRVIIPHVDHELIDRLIVNPSINREFLTDLWNMPMFELEYHPNIGRTLFYIKDSAASIGKERPLISGLLEISEYDLIGSLSLTSTIKEKVNHFLDLGVDILHVHGLRNKDEYYVTSRAVRALHHYLMRIGRRHEVSIIASGGIRLASDTQKTIQRGAEATLIDFAALLALDPTAYKAIIENKATTEKLLSLDTEWAIKRLNNQAESRKVQILEVLGASGFKDLKKTVGEEGRLIDFHKLENRIQHSIFEDEPLLRKYDRLNRELIQQEPIPREKLRSYRWLKARIKPQKYPHDFYRLGDTNQNLYKRDFVWPGPLIENMGKMAAGDLSMLNFNNVQATGLLGDGFDVMKILYNKDPMDIHEPELESVSTALPIDKDLILEAPWMFGGKSVGSIGLDTWKAHVTAARQLGIQYDTGEGGYPTCFFLNSKGEPLFFTEDEIQLIKPFFRTGREYKIREMQNILNENGISKETHPAVFDKIAQYPTLKPFQFLVVVDDKDEPFVSTELKTGLFGVTKQSIKKARRVVIAYSQGAKMGIGGHILAQKVNKLVSYCRGIEGIEILQIEKVEQLFQQLKNFQDSASHPLKDCAAQNLKNLENADEIGQASDELKSALWNIQETAYQLHADNNIDPIDFEHVIRLTEEIIKHSYTSIISPFPFHNCYSIEDVKAFIDVVRMLNPNAVISIKVSPSIDIEFIAAGLARIARDNTDEMLSVKFREWRQNQEEFSVEMAEYAKKYGMKIEIWLDGPRGGTGASPNIIKGQMGMHIEYAIPLIHYRLVQDGLRNHVKFMVSGGIRTYEDVIKAVALGADGVIWGTAPMVAIGCDRNRNCHDGCSRGIATSNLVMQKLRDVESNTQQIINAFTMLQMQVIRALAALGFRDLRELRGRYDKIHWIGLKERVDHRYRIRQEVIKEIEKDEKEFEERMAHHTGQSNCGVAAINGTAPIPGHILDQTLQSLRNRGMDGVGIAKTMCFPEHPHEYAYRILVKGVLQKDIEAQIRHQWKKSGNSFTIDELRQEARTQTISIRTNLMKKIKSVFLDPYFIVSDGAIIREPYKSDQNNNERDYRDFGGENTDPGDIFRCYVKVKPDHLEKYIQTELLLYKWSRFLKQLFPVITKDNYRSNKQFMGKAEDLCVFNHSLKLSRILYVSSIHQAELERFAGSRLIDNKYDAETFLSDDFNEHLTVLRDFNEQHPYEHHRHRYTNREHKIAAVMSCGKNFGLWKTAGREIPWQTPDAPNNIIHVRLATGSVVEQMNSHPFGKLHTALTHNGETTNYEALKQRVEQFDLSPLASTDTEVASLKFHLTAEEWEYPDWALFESFSPTTGEDLQLIDPNIRHQLEQVQRVEFSSSPDGPYQYLCLRHNPQNNTTERVDLKDPADLRPNISAFWYDEKNHLKRAFSIIASEEHAVHTMLKLLDKEGIIDGAMPDKTYVSNGMISRYRFDKQNNVTDFIYLDRYGRKIDLEQPGEHYSIRRESVKTPKDSSQYDGWDARYQDFFQENVAYISFNDFRWLLHYLIEKDLTNATFWKKLDILTWLRDYLRTLNPGQKALSSLIDITQYYINHLLDRSSELKLSEFSCVDQHHATDFHLKPEHNQTLIIDASSFLPEGIDHEVSLAAFLTHSYSLGWRRYILYRVSGQRLISPAVMGNGNTDDVVIDVYGSAGEYFGAFMQGGILRLHGNAQNFCAMCMHHGEIYVHGNAGKVCGYASKGGKVFIMGNIVDRGWTNSVNDSRCQNLEISILGSATKYLGESLMGGNFFFAGLHFDNTGALRFNERPYLGTKMMGGASRGMFVFFDPENRLIEAQYTHGIIQEFTSDEWNYFQQNILETFLLSNIPVQQNGANKFIIVEDAKYEIIPDNFKLIVPRGGLKGYESH